MEKNSNIIKEVVEEMGGRIREAIPERHFFFISFGEKEIMIERKFSLFSSFFSEPRFARYKDITQYILEKNKIPVPRSLTFYRKSFVQNDIQKLKKLNFPIVIKDAEGSNSRGVYANIPDYKSAVVIFKKQIQNFKALIVQEMVIGNEYRILVLGNKVIAALELIPPRVFGDGKSNIKKLIEIKQKSTPKKTEIDNALEHVLKQQGYSLNSILKKGSEVFIKRNSSLGEGGETKDVTDTVNKDIENLCVKASHSIGKDLSGIDLICEDVTKKPTEQKFSIIEINGKPDIYIHYNPTIGTTKNVVKEIIKYMLEKR